VHLDLKGENVFCTVEGSWFIGDFGSMRPVGQPVLSTTTDYYTEDIIHKPAAFKYDWFMLLVLLVIETLNIKHKAWRAVLHRENTSFVSEVQLFRLVSILKGWPVYQALFEDIETRLGTSTVATDVKEEGGGSLRTEEVAPVCVNPPAGLFYEAGAAADTPLFTPVFTARSVERKNV
jgi:hypothetical protein